jgi:hypothetical protein
MRKRPLPLRPIFNSVTSDLAADHLAFAMRTPNATSAHFSRSAIE